MPPPDQAQVKDAAAPGVRVEIRKKPDLPPRFGTGPVPPAATNTGADDPAARDRLMQTDPVEDGFGDMRFPGAAPQQPEADPAQPAPEADLETKLAAIRAEKLTERQLRIARRIATMHQITVASDEEAVLRLRERGIDPSHRAAVGRILSDEGSKAQAAPAANPPVPLPRAPVPARAPAVPAKPDLPSREDMTEERRAAEIHRIQQDIAARRRRRMIMLIGRLMVFVFLPTAVMGWYYFRVATPLYATYTQFLIQQAEGGGGGVGGLFSGTQLAMNNDSVAVQSYLTSRDAMLRLDGDMGFRTTYQSPEIDPVKRLPANATNEATYRVYKNSVKIGYDPTEGVIKMEVIAPDAQLSQDFSLALIGYAEGQVDQLTARLRDDQMSGSIQNYEDAETKVLEAQRRVQELQQRLGVLDPAAEGSVVMGRVASLEGQLAQRELELGQILSNPRPQQSRVDTIRGDIARLQDMIAETRLQLTQGSEQRASLASISGELRIAEGDLSTRQALLATAAEQVEAARIEANKQVRYLSVVVAPVAPDEATYPKAVQNTFVAMLIFAGVYLMLSLTASILREQVSS